MLDNGNSIGFLGVSIDKKDETRQYLRDYLLGKTVFIKDIQTNGSNGRISGYIYLKNKLFINAYLIKSGLGSPDDRVDHRYFKKFHRWAAAAVQPATPPAD